MTCLLILGPDMVKLHIDETLHPWFYTSIKGQLGVTPNISQRIFGDYKP